MESKYIVISSNSNNFINQFTVPVHLNEKIDYEIALVSLDLFYCIPNITEDNNIFRFSIDNGKKWKDIEIPIGCYTLNSLYEEIVKILTYSGDIHPFTFSSISSRVRTVITITDQNFQIDFSFKKSFGKILGFDKVLNQFYNESRNPINMLINSIFVKTNLTSDSIYNKSHFPFIYSFFPNALPGDKIIETPVNLVYLNLNNKSVHNIEITLVDENGKSLDFNGETVTIILHLRSKL